MRFHKTKSSEVQRYVLNQTSVSRQCFCSICKWWFSEMHMDFDCFELTL